MDSEKLVRHRRVGGRPAGRLRVSVNLTTLILSQNREVRGLDWELDGREQTSKWCAQDDKFMVIEVKMIQL